MKTDDFFHGFFAIGQFFTSDKISFWEKACAVTFILIYIFSPIDLIPDFIPVVGWCDDIGVGALFLAYCAWRVNSKNTKELGSPVSENNSSSNEKDEVVQPQIVYPPRELPPDPERSRDRLQGSPEIFRDNTTREK